MEQAAPGGGFRFRHHFFNKSEQAFAREKDFEARGLGVLPLKFPREIFLEAGSPAEPPNHFIIRAGRALAKESPESRL